MRFGAVTLGFLVALATATLATATPPPNDDCGTAIAIAGSVLRDDVDTTDATTAADDPPQSCTTGGPSQNTHSLWYRITPSANGRLFVDTRAGFPADPPTIVSIHTGACGALAEVACDDHENELASYVRATLAARVQYLIAVTNETGSPGGPIEVDVRFVPDSPICPDDGGYLPKLRVSMRGMAAPLGDEELKLDGVIALNAAHPDVAATGMQLLIEDRNADYAPVFEWSARTLAIPPGGVGAGCGPKDGWTTSANGLGYRYRNASNAFPPACTPGSANGLRDARVKVDRRHPENLTVKVRTAGATIADLPDLGPFAAEAGLRAAVTFDPTIGASNRDRCAWQLLGSGGCKVAAGGAKIDCKTP